MKLLAENKTFSLDVHYIKYKIVTIHDPFKTNLINFL